MLIVGAGLSGLVAAHFFPAATILEECEEPQQRHRALLRFRSPLLGERTGIPFRRVTVFKNVWSDGQLRNFVTVADMNRYARKVTPLGLTSRSIHDLSPCQRWIAPDDWQLLMIEQCRSRITFGEAFDFSRPSREPVISTAPLPSVAKMAGISCLEPFLHNPIRVHRYLVPGADVFQTVYFPDNSSLYRASITGSVLIAESLDRGCDPPPDIDEQKAFLENVFGLEPGCLRLLEYKSQKYGKIAPISEPVRRALIRRLSTDFNIYSFGRFATWRNILLDDLPKDAAAIASLIGMSEYDRMLSCV
jgi:hypothetical protein